MIRVATVVGLLGVLLAAGLVAWQGVGEVFAALAVAGWGLVWASLFHFVAMGFNAHAWRVLMPGRKLPSLGFFVWIVWVRESVNGLLPVARIGGEVVTTRLMIRHGFRPAVSAGGIVVDVTLSMVSQFLFTLIGLALLIQRSRDWAVIGNVALGLLLTVVLVGAFLAAQRVGLFGLLAKFFRMLFGDRFDGLVGGAKGLDQAVKVIYRRPRRIVSCTFWQFVGWIAGSGEIWLAAWFLGYPLDLEDAILIESLIQAVSSSAFVVPGAAGLQEGAFLLVGGLVGMPSEGAIALALARRARDILLFVPGLLTWQWDEGRGLFSGRKSLVS